MNVKYFMKQNEKMKNFGAFQTAYSCMYAIYSIDRVRSVARNSGPCSLNLTFQWVGLGGIKYS